MALLLDAPLVRGWLAFQFEAPPASLTVALDTLASNVAIALVALGAALGLASLATARTAEARRRRFVFRATRLWGDLALAVVWAGNVAVVGAGLGAYGGRFAMALLPHGPIELAGFAIALGAYLEARAGRARSRDLGYALLGTITLLAVAAVLETWARPVIARSVSRLAAVLVLGVGALGIGWWQLERSGALSELGQLTEPRAGSPGRADRPDRPGQARERKPPGRGSVEDGR